MSGQQVEVPDFDIGPVVDTTSDRDLLHVASAWAGGAVDDEANNRACGNGLC